MLALVTMAGAPTGVQQFQQTGVNRTYYIQVRSSLSTQPHTQVPALLVRHHTSSQADTHSGHNREDC